MKCAALVAVALAACAHGQDPNAVTANDAILTIRCNLADADLVLDGHPIGRVDLYRHGLAVDPGHHRLEVRRDDYYSAYVDLELARAEHKQLDVALWAVLP